MIERGLIKRGLKESVHRCYRGMQDATQSRKNLGQKIRKLREKRGLSQEAFAHDAKLARSFAGGIERGERDIRLSTLCKIADFFGVTLSELVKGTDANKPGV